MLASKSAGTKNPTVLGKWSQMIEKYQDRAFIRPSKKAAFATILENEMKHLPRTLKENMTSTGSFISSTGASALGTVPFYIGVIRRAFPKLVGMNLFGVQPLSQPGGVIFATKRTYKGTPNANSAHASITSVNSRVVVVADIGTVAIGDAVQFRTAAAGAGDLVASALVVYLEGSKVLVKVTSFAGAYTMDDIVAGNSTTGSKVFLTGKIDSYVTAKFENFAAYDVIFSNYTVFKSNALGINNDEFDGTQIREVGSDVIKIPIDDIQNRKIRSKISQEILEDMQSFKYNIQEDLMNIMLEDITSEMNREFYGHLKNGAESKPTVDFEALTGATDLDKYIQIIAKATNMSNQIAVDLKTGVGNYMTISPALLSAFTTLGKYWNYTNDPSVGNVNMKLGNFATEPMVGKFNNMWDLYVDIFDESNTVMVGHYSDNNLDNAFFYLPYIALTPDVMRDPNTGNWVLHYRTRYAIKANPYGSQRWIKKFNVDKFAI